MRLFKGILATTHIDKHNERLAYEVLESMVAQINRAYIPVGVEHDPRIPPKGRVVSARLVELEDGEYGVEGVIEIFEDGDDFEIRNDDREMPIRWQSDDKVHIIFDRSYFDDESQETIGEIREVIGVEVGEEGKKSIEPISVLIIALSAAAGHFLAGLLEKIGADAWDYFKCKISSLLQRRKAERSEYLLSFQFSVHKPEQQLVEIILINPAAHDIEKFFDEGLRLVDKVVPSLLSTTVPVKKVTLEYKDGRLSILFGVRKDAVPVFLKIEQSGPTTASADSGFAARERGRDLQHE